MGNLLCVFGGLPDDPVGPDYGVRAVDRATREEHQMSTVQQPPGIRGQRAARYAAGETMPTVRDSASYLTDGEGVLGVGRTVDDTASPSATERATGPFCSTCGTRNDTDASFCDHCGAALAH